MFGKERTTVCPRVVNASVKLGRVCSSLGGLVTACTSSLAKHSSRIPMPAYLTCVVFLAGLGYQENWSRTAELSVLEKRPTVRLETSTARLNTRDKSVPLLKRSLLSL